ncbi:MAG TPA: TAXI family TRAP transporter solute-binding subunit [Candidatus Eisenbacteria bacterium]|nr:TAXI family TRAP transporter solute-binding subunit [Candidatus Eisenbacteria bacterium]
MVTGRNRYGFFLAGCLLFELLWVLPAGAQQASKSVAIGTNTPGTLFYALAGGLAKVISDHSSVQATVQPYSGTSTFLPLLNTGELDFGIVNGVDMGMAYAGPKLKVGGRNPFPHSPNTRLVMRGAPLRAAAVVRKDSGIKSMADVKGKRVTGEYPAHLAVWYNMFGILASAGLTWKDVVVVPVPAVNDGVDALIQGRADVSTHALGSAKIKEADAAVGIRYVSIDCSPEGEKRLRAAVPGYYPTKLNAGASTGVVEETCFETYDIYFATHKGAPDRVITEALNALWENINQLPPLHPGFREWTRERAASADVTIPYHPAAARFYKEKGVWTAEMEQAQKKFSGQN